MIVSPRLEQGVQVGLFLLFLALPALDTAFDLDPARALDHEARVAPPTAPAGLADLETWRDDFERYYDDTFGWRSLAVRSFNRLNYRFFRVSQEPSVIVGKDGWLFYGNLGEQYHRATEPYRGTERKRWGRSVLHRQAWLEEQGIRYLFTIAPNKHTIYPEYLPARSRRSGPYSRYEQLVDYFEKNQATVARVDLHAALFAAKERELVYERTGTHWNTRGAYVVYQALFAQLDAWFPQLEPVLWSQLRLRGEGPGELPRMLGIEGLVDEELPKVIAGVRYPRPRVVPYQRLVTEQDDKTLPRAVVFHDSFTASLIPFLAEHFSYAVFQWDTVFDGQLILEVGPDVVIDERVERELLLPSWRNHLPPISAASSPGGES